VEIIGGAVIVCSSESLVCTWSINRVANPNPVYSHTHTCENITARVAQLMFTRVIKTCLGMTIPLAPKNSSAILRHRFLQPWLPPLWFRNPRCFAHSLHAGLVSCPMKPSTVQFPPASYYSNIFPSVNAEIRVKQPSLLVIRL
jgi:hypothetical protein